MQCLLSASIINYWKPYPLSDKIPMSLSKGDTSNHSLHSWYPPIAWPQPHQWSTYYYHCKLFIVLKSWLVISMTHCPNVRTLFLVSFGFANFHFIYFAFLKTYLLSILHYCKLTTHSKTMVAPCPFCLFPIHYYRPHYLQHIIEHFMVFRWPRGTNAFWILSVWCHMRFLCIPSGIRFDC